MKHYTELTKRLAVIPIALGVVLLWIVIAMFLALVYISAYVFPAVGLLIVLASLLTLNLGGFLIGLFIAGFGGWAYIEWFENDLGSLPTVTEILGRTGRYFRAGVDHF